jgi:hypothetical protein
MVVVL